MMFHDEDLEKLIQFVIDMFNGQRIEGNQFAVLFLMEDSNFTEMKFRTKEKTVRTTAEATNSKYPIFPSTNMLYNYVCARPDKYNPQKKLHAEVLLLARLDSLLRSYRSCGHNCQLTVLYTWLLPCPKCKDKIIETLGSSGDYSRYQVILAYSTSVNYHKKETGLYHFVHSLHTVKELEEAGIKVLHKTRKCYINPIHV